jgi:superfamily II DNA or RNA helicase
MELHFDRGTLRVLHPPPGFDGARIAGLRWDPRISAWRAPAWLHATVLRTLRDCCPGQPVLDRASGWRERVPGERARWRAAAPRLRPYQEAAVWAWQQQGRRGIVALPTGSGKTWVALGAMARLAVPTLVLAPTRVLMHQWRRLLAGAVPGEVGLWGDGQRRLAPLTVSTFESAWRHMPRWGDRFGLLVLDEAHHFGGPGHTRRALLEMSVAPYRLGLSATPPDGDPPATPQALVSSSPPREGTPAPTPAPSSKPSAVAPPARSPAPPRAPCQESRAAPSPPPCQESCAAWSLGLSVGPSPERLPEGPGAPKVPDVLEVPPVPEVPEVLDLVGPVVYRAAVGELVGRYLAPFDRVTVHLDLSAEERRRYDRDYGAFRAFHTPFRLAHPGASWKEFMTHARRSEEGRRAVAAWRASRRLLGYTAAKRDLVLRLLARHRSQPVLVFTGDNATAYRIAREALIMPITCDIGRAERDEALERFRHGELRALVSSRVLNEGLDVPDAEVAILVGGNAGVREYVQRIGRVLRPAPGKRAVVYELVTLASPEVRKARDRELSLGPLVDVAP